MTAAVGPTEKGLTEKGRRRRAALLDAVVAVLEREGPGAVTHRAVAAEAGVPVSAATYYFATIDDLLVEALRRAVDEEAELLPPATPIGGTAALARVLHEYAVQRRATAVAHYELLLLATRRPALRPDAERWYASLEAALDAGFPTTAGEHPDDRAQRLSSAAMALDGLILRMLWRGEPSTPAAVERSLEPLLHPLLPEADPRSRGGVSASS